MSRYEAEIRWFEHYALGTVEDQRRAAYGRACYDLVRFIVEHADVYPTVYTLRDAAHAEFRAVLEATFDLGRNGTEATA